MGRRRFVGDVHLGHRAVAEMRGFASVAAHDAAIMDALMQVGPADETYFMGDLSCGPRRDEDRALEMLAVVPGAKHLLAGNHDSVSSMHRRGWHRMDAFRVVFDSVRDFARLNIDGRQVMLSHFPYADQGDGVGRGEPRYMQYRLPDLGAPLIHAHTHDDVPSRPEFPRQLCVSWDAWGRLVEEQDVVQWLRSSAA